MVFSPNSEQSIICHMWYLIKPPIIQGMFETPTSRAGHQIAKFFEATSIHKVFTRHGCWLKSCQFGLPGSTSHCQSCCPICQLIWILTCSFSWSMVNGMIIQILAYGIQCLREQCYMYWKWLTKENIKNMQDWFNVSSDYSQRKSI